MPNSAGMSDRERIARLERSDEDTRNDITEIKADVKNILNIIAQMSGGKKAVLGLFGMIGAIGGIIGTIIAGWFGKGHV